MTLTATKTPTGYAVEGTDAVGKPVEIFFDSNASRNFDYLTNVVDSFHKDQAYSAGMKRIQENDPEHQLLVSIFGSGDEPQDTALHTTLVEAQEARNGVELDWSQDPVTAVLRLITTGNSNRLRLFAGNLVDMGPSAGFPVGAPLGEGPGPETVVQDPTGQAVVEAENVAVNPQYLG